MGFYKRLFLPFLNKRNYYMIKIYSHYKKDFWGYIRWKRSYKIRRVIYSLLKTNKKYYSLMLNFVYKGIKFSNRKLKYKANLMFVKKRIKLFYGYLRDRYLGRLGRLVKGKQGLLVDLFFSILERRLDVLLYRSLYAISIRFARYYIYRRLTAVNFSRVYKPQMLVFVGDHVQIFGRPFNYLFFQYIFDRSIDTLQHRRMLHKLLIRKLGKDKFFKKFREKFMNLFIHKQKKNVINFSYKFKFILKKSKFRDKTNSNFLNILYNYIYRFTKFLLFILCFGFAKRVEFRENRESFNFMDPFEVLVIKLDRFFTSTLKYRRWVSYRLDTFMSQQFIKRQRNKYKKQLNMILDRSKRFSTAIKIYEQLIKKAKNDLVCEQYKAYLERLYKAQLGDQNKKKEVISILRMINRNIRHKRVFFLEKTRQFKNVFFFRKKFFKSLYKFIALLRNINFITKIYNPYTSWIRLYGLVNLRLRFVKFYNIIRPIWFRGRLKRQAYLMRKLKLRDIKLFRIWGFSKNVFDFLKKMRNFYFIFRGYPSYLEISYRLHIFILINNPSLTTVYYPFSVNNYMFFEYFRRKSYF